MNTKIFALPLFALLLSSSGFAATYTGSGSGESSLVACGKAADDLTARVPRNSTTTNLGSYAITKVKRTEIKERFWSCEFTIDTDAKATKTDLQTFTRKDEATGTSLSRVESSSLYHAFNSCEAGYSSTETRESVERRWFLPIFSEFVNITADSEETYIERTTTCALYAVDYATNGTSKGTSREACYANLVKESVEKFKTKCDLDGLTVRGTPKPYNGDSYFDQKPGGWECSAGLTVSCR